MSTGPQVARLGRLARRLVDEGAIDAEAAMEGRVAVRDLSRSNPVGRVEVDGRPVLVVKERSASAEDAAAPDAEAAAYRWLASSPATAAVAPAPVFDVGWPGVHVTQPVAGGVTLHEALMAAPDAREQLVAGLGRLLGSVHAAGVDECELPVRRPWILDVPRHGIPPAFRIGDAAARLGREIGRRPAVVGAIERLAGTWTARTIVHGDVKFDNVIVAEGRLVLVDWELAGRGDPVWDLAGVVDGLLIALCVSAARAPVVDRALVATLAAPALSAHRAVAGPALSPSADALAPAVVARLVQTSVQLAAMADGGGDAAEGADRMLAAASDLGDDMLRDAGRGAPGRCPA